MFNGKKHSTEAFGGSRIPLPRIFLMAFAFSAAASASARAESCDLSTLSGSYLFSAQGFNIVDGMAQPKAIIEGIDFHGDGTLVAPFAVISVNGTILRSAESTGTYTVNPDCTGAIAFTSGPAFDIFTTRTGRKIWLLQTGGSPPAVFEGTAQKLR